MGMAVDFSTVPYHSLCYGKAPVRKKTGMLCRWERIAELFLTGEKFSSGISDAQVPSHAE